MNKRVELSQKGLSASVDPDAAAALGAGALLPALFRTEHRYGWSIGMRAVSLALLSGVSPPPGWVVDLGCGGGAMLAQLHRILPGRSILGVDLHPLAVVQASRSSPGQIVQSDIVRLPLADGSVALLTALDAFDQYGVDLERALDESHRALRDGGLLLLRVSAFAGLAGPHDHAFNTAFRYDKGQIVRAAANAGFKVKRCTYANMLLSPPVAIVRLLQRSGRMPLAESLYANPMINRAVAASLSIESRTLQRRNMPFGLSLYVLACKE